MQLAKTAQEQPYLMKISGHRGNGKLILSHSYREKVGHFLPLVKNSSGTYVENQLLYLVPSPRLEIPGDKVSLQSDRQAEISTSRCVTNL